MSSSSSFFLRLFVVCLFAAVLCICIYWSTFCYNYVLIYVILDSGLRLSIYWSTSFYIPASVFLYTGQYLSIYLLISFYRYAFTYFTGLRLCTGLQSFCYWFTAFCVYVFLCTGLQSFYILVYGFLCTGLRLFVHLSVFLNTGLRLSVCWSTSLVIYIFLYIGLCLLQLNYIFLLTSFLTHDTELP